MKSPPWSPWRKSSLCVSLTIPFVILISILVFVSALNSWKEAADFQEERLAGILRRMEVAAKAFAELRPPPEKPAEKKAVTPVENAKVVDDSEQLYREERVEELEEQAIAEFESFKKHRVQREKTAKIDVNSTTCMDARHSQHGEDMDMLRRFFSTDAPSYKTNGFFLEMGALDGLTFSNTFFYEYCLGWSGLLIEGQPENAIQLKKNRAGTNVMRLAMAACEEDGSVLHFPVRGSAVSGSLSHMSERHKSVWNKNFGDSSVDVPCGPLRKYLALLNITHIDFFSLDVEGAELLVLKTIDWTTITVDVLMVELQGSKEKDQAIRSYLHGVGYELYVPPPSFGRVLGPNWVFLPSHSPFLLGKSSGK